MKETKQYPRQLLYHDKKGYGEIFDDDPLGVNIFLARICQTLISKCELNNTCVNLVDIINESFYRSIKITQQPDDYSGSINEKLKTELTEQLGSQEKAFISKVLIYLLLTLNKDISDECKKILEELEKNLKQEISVYSNFSSYGFSKWLKEEKKDQGFNLYLPLYPRQISELEDYEINELTEKFELEKIKNVVNLYDSQVDKIQAINCIRRSLSHYKDKLALNDKEYNERLTFLEGLQDSTSEETKKEKRQITDKELIDKLTENMIFQASLLEIKERLIIQLQAENSEYKAKNEKLLNLLKNKPDSSENTESIFHEPLQVQDIENTNSDRQISLYKLVVTAQHWGNEEEANKFELFLRRTLGSNITKEDNLLIEQINSFYNDKIEKEKNERHDVLEVLQNIPKQPTTKNEYNIYPQPNSQNFYGADMKGVQIRALSPSAIPQNQKLMNHKRENNNEQKNK